MNQDQSIENEVQRRIASIQQQHHNEIRNRDESISSLTNNLLNIKKVVERFEALPFYFGIVIRVDNTPDPYRFHTQDQVVVVDADGDYYGMAGKIISHNPVVAEDGTVEVELSNGLTRRFQIGTEGAAQIHLVDKADGTRVIVNVDGKPWEVRGAPELNLKPTNIVKIHSETKQIVSHAEQDLLNGPIVLIDAITEDGVEISEKGEKKIVLNTLDIEIKEGDRVMVDSGFHVILRKLAQDGRDRYKLGDEATIDWDDIGGLESAKTACRESIELPYTHPEQFAFYKKKPSNGILLYGPPGCGKTLIARALATSLMRTHTKGDADVLDTGFIYVKSPEILDKWVGNTESEIRRLFERSRQHYRDHGYKAILAFDEFDAIAPQRGSRRSSDVADTIVPMFLGEMSGANEKETQENPIVVLMTNRSDVLDPAITRPGRITEHIKVERPTPKTTLQILQIHTQDVPFAEENIKVLFAVVCQDIFSKSRLLYRVNNEHDFTFGDCISGAMIEAICERAKLIAMRRDIANNTLTGLTLDDFRQSIQKTYEDQRGLNHSYDLADFADKLGIQAKDMKVDRCFGTS